MKEFISRRERRRAQLEIYSIREALKRKKAKENPLYSAFLCSLKEVNCKTLWKNSTKEQREKLFEKNPEEYKKVKEYYDGLNRDK